MVILRSLLCLIPLLNPGIDFSHSGRHSLRRPNNVRSAMWARLLSRSDAFLVSSNNIGFTLSHVFHLLHYTIHVDTLQLPTYLLSPRSSPCLRVKYVYKSLASFFLSSPSATRLLSLRASHVWLRFVCGHATSSIYYYFLLLSISIIPHRPRFAFSRSLVAFLRLSVSTLTNANILCGGHLTWPPSVGATSFGTCQSALQMRRAVLLLLSCHQVPSSSCLSLTLSLYPSSHSFRLCLGRHTRERHWHSSYDALDSRGQSWPTRDFHQSSSLTRVTASMDLVESVCFTTYLLVDHIPSHILAAQFLLTLGVEQRC